MGCTQSLPNIFRLFTMNVSDAKASFFFFPFVYIFSWEIWQQTLIVDNLMHLQITQLLNPSIILIRLQNCMEFLKNFNTNFNAKSIRWLEFISLLTKIIKELYSCLTCCCTQSLPNIFSFFTMNVSNAKTSKGVCMSCFCETIFFFWFGQQQEFIRIVLLKWFSRFF